MSDVLIQNAFAENRALTRCYLTRGTGSCSLNSFTVANNGYCGTLLTCGSQPGSGSVNPLTCFTQYWSSLPTLNSPTAGFKVCDTSGYYRCGAQCNWTVPTGVCCVQFQLWGPGSGTGTNCCCGGAPFGPTGAYATVIMNVTPGHVYCLCAGCAYCCYATETTPGYCGQPSHVIGCGLTSFCADSGISDVCCWRAAVGSTSSGCQFPTADNCGPNSCSGWNYCWDSGNDGGFIYWSYSGATKYYGSSSCNGTVYGINGMYPALCIGSDNQSGGYTHAAPVYGFVADGQCCSPHHGSTCAGCCFSFVHGSGRHPYPGQGGYSSHVSGGCGANGGDSGRMGMVCVRYCCI